MNKKLLILLAIAMVVIVPSAACGRTAPTGIKKPPAPTIPHAIDVRFKDCLVCHASDQLTAPAHVGKNNTSQNCTFGIACHKLAS